MSLFELFALKGFAGGAGNPSGAAALFVKFTNDGDGNWIADRSLDEVYSVWENGGRVIFDVAPCNGWFGFQVAVTEYMWNEGHIFYGYFSQGDDTLHKFIYSNEGIDCLIGGDSVYPD